MLAREYAHTIKQKDKPIILSHTMLMGLKEGQQKMSKSNPESAIFMEDTEEDVKRKIKNAFCPKTVCSDNPIINYTQFIVFPALKGKPLHIERDEKWGGNISYNSFEELKADFVEGTLSPEDLKAVVCKQINILLEPVRKHFNTDPYAKKLLATIKRW